MQTFEFQLTHEDWRADLRGGASKWWEFNPRWSVAGVILIGFALGLAESISQIEINHPVEILMLLAAMIGFGQVGRVLSIRRAVARWTPPAGPTRIEIGDEHIVLTQEGAQRFEPWDKILAVAITDAHVVLGKPGDRILIPLRAFADRNAMIRFFGACEDRIHAEEDRRAETGQALDADLEVELAPETKLPEHPLAVTVALRGDEWPAVQKDMNPGRTLTLDQSALYCTIIGGLMSGGAATLFTTIAGRSLDLVTWLAFAWPGAIVVTWFGARAYEKAKRKLQEDVMRHTLAYEITLASTGVTRRSKGVVVHLDWSAIQRLELKSENILFGTPWNEFFIAPKCCFAEEQDYWSFFSAARQWRRAAQQQAAGAAVTLADRSDQN